MADTSQQELSEPHTNGVVDGLTEEEKSKMRPADIDADMREMERRKRVEMMMNSRLFREELERIIETQMKDGAGASGLLQQISDMMGAQGARFNANMFKNSNCVVPINDIRGVESMGYAKGEKLLRCKLAAVFRLLDLYGWTQGVGGQITARLNQDQEHFLVNPYGLLYHEVTASSLVKVDMQGAVVEQGTTNFGVHITGFQLHSTIHAARPDIKCIVHISTPSVTAISSLKCGLLPLGQESIVIGDVSTHQYISGSLEPEEREKISRNLGPINKVMLLTNRGALCCGESVEEAFFNVYNTVLACETQLKLMPIGMDNLSLISDESKKAIFEASRKPPVPQQSSVAEPSPLAEKLEKRWRIGGTEFEALMRMLDNAGFRTGYIYRNPLVKSEPPRPRNDVEVPPAVSSLGYLIEEEDLYKQGLWKGGRKGTDRSRWLNSPNVYQKVEILETGTPDPKKITKWVSDGSPTHSSTPVKIDSALQFVPKNTNPKEFKQIQQQIKDYRRADKISAGPQSHILEGVSWEEAKKMQDATISGTGEQVVLVGAASKGIIQRGFQHNAMVYKTPYAKNPFDAVTDQELDQYKKDVERKQKGDPYDESQSESEALSSFNASRATHESSTAKSPIQSPVSVTSETEEESRDEPRVLRIETRQVPAPSQPEVVLSDVVSRTVEDGFKVMELQSEPKVITGTHQKLAAADATTEFLNEMRRSALDPQNDHSNKKDFRLSRECSNSISSTYSNGSLNTTPSDSIWLNTEPYETLHLEVTRIATIAERKKPILMDVHPPAMKICETEILPAAPSKTKLTDILKRAFLEKYDETIHQLSLSSNEKFAAKLSKINSQTLRRNYLNSLSIEDKSISEIDENRISTHVYVKSVSSCPSEIVKCCNGKTFCFDCRRIQLESFDFFGTPTTKNRGFFGKRTGSKSFENLATSGENFICHSPLERFKKTKSFEFAENLGKTVQQRIESFVVLEKKKSFSNLEPGSSPIAEKSKTVDSQNVSSEIPKSSGEEEIFVGLEIAEVENSSNLAKSEDPSSEKSTVVKIEPIGVLENHEKSVESSEKNGTIAEAEKELPGKISTPLTDYKIVNSKSSEFSDLIQQKNASSDNSKEEEEEAEEHENPKKELPAKICSSLTDDKNVNSKSSELSDLIQQKNASSDNSNKEEEAEEHENPKKELPSKICSSLTDDKHVNSKSSEFSDLIQQKNASSENSKKEKEAKELENPRNLAQDQISSMNSNPGILKKRLPKNRESLSGTIKVDIKKLKLFSNSETDELENIQGDNNFTKETEDFLRDLVWEEEVRKFAEDRSSDSNGKKAFVTSRNFNPIWNEKMLRYFNERLMAEPEDSSIDDDSKSENRTKDDLSKESEKLQENPSLDRETLEKIATNEEKVVPIDESEETEKEKFRNDPEPEESLQRNALERDDSMSDVLRSIKTNIMSSKIVFEPLPETDNSVKYNLDSTNMSLIYSLTPTGDVNSQTSDDTCCELSNGTVTGGSRVIHNDELTDPTINDNPEEDDVDDDDNNSAEFYWYDLASNAKRVSESEDLHEPLDNLFDDNSSTGNFSEISNQASDILELPHQTVCELRENETFFLDMNETVNEILADLDYSKSIRDTVVNQIVDEILSSNVQVNYKDDIRNLVLRKLESLRPAGDDLRPDENHLQDEDNPERRSNVSLKDFDRIESDPTTLTNSIVESENESFQSASTFVGDFLVVEEIIHHIIDKVEYKRRKKTKDRGVEDPEVGGSAIPVNSLDTVSSSIEETQGTSSSLSFVQDESFFLRTLLFSRTRHLSLEKNLDDPTRDSFISVSSFHESMNNLLDKVCDVSPLSSGISRTDKNHLYRSYRDIRDSPDLASRRNDLQRNPWICPCLERLQVEEIVSTSSTPEPTPEEPPNSSLAVLEFCTVATPTRDSKNLKLNFDVQEFDETRKSFGKTTTDDERIRRNVEKLRIRDKKLTCDSKESLPNEQQSSLSENNAELEVTSSDSSDFECEKPGKPSTGCKLNEYIGNECEEPEVQSFQDHLELSLEWNRSFDFQLAPNEFDDLEENNNNNNIEEVADSSYGGFEKDEKFPVCTCCLEGDIVYDNDSDTVIINYNSNLSSLPSISEEEDEVELEEKEANFELGSDLKIVPTEFENSSPGNPCTRATRNSRSALATFPTISEAESEESFESEVIQCLEEKAGSWKNFLSPRSLGTSCLNVEDPSSPEYFSCKDESCNFVQSDEEKEKEKEDADEAEKVEEKFPSGKRDPKKDTRSSKVGKEILEEGIDTKGKVLDASDENQKDESPPTRKFLPSSSSPSSSSSFSSSDVDNGFNRTYTISESSKNSESPTYNADVSGNIDESGSNNQFSFPSKRRFKKGEGDFNVDTTANFADVSKNGTFLEEEFLEMQRNDNCMTVSYDTEEFLIIEKSIRNEELVKGAELDPIRDCHQSYDIFTVSPLNPLPKYEDTTLCKVISEINLTDSADSRE